MGLEWQRDLELFLQILWSKLSFILFLCFIFDISKKIATLQFVHPMRQKSLNLVEDEKNIEKCSMISICSLGSLL